MKKIVFILTGTVAILFAVAMCVSGRSRATSRDDVHGDSVVVSTGSAIPDSVIQLLTVVMPDSMPQQMLVRKGYITSYNKETRLPNWVAWRITAETADGQWQRLKQYHEDEDVPEPRATP